MAEGVNMDVVATFRANISDMQGNLRTLEADLQKLQGTAKATESSFEAMGKKATEVGKEMSLKVTAPLLAIGTAAAGNAFISAKSIAANDYLDVDVPVMPAGAFIQALASANTSITAHMLSGSIFS